MGSKFSTFENRLIILSISKQSVEQIADLLDKPFVDVRKQVNELAAAHQLNTYAEINKKFLQHRQRLDEKRKGVMKRQEMQQVKAKRNEPLFQTRQVDYSQMRSVRIDARTFISIRPDQDPETEKIKFLKHHKKLTA